MMVPPTRFSRWHPFHARLLLALLLGLCSYGTAVALQPAPPGREVVVDLTRTDLALYQAVAGRVGEGESYYAAVVAEQRARNYPLRPFVTVRLPTLATVIGTAGAEAATLLLRLLALAATAAVALRLRSAAGSKSLWAAGTFVAAASIVLLTVPVMTYWHESWAGLLIAISLFCRSDKRWGLSVALGFAAALVRELALPFLCVMTVLALRDGKRAEAAAWVAAILFFFAALTAHALAIAAYVHGADAASPGWAGGGGWAFVLGLVQRCTLFGLLPLPLVAIFLPVALIGWSSLGDGIGDRGSLVLLAYLGAFTLIGRPDNFYWGILIAPLLPMGLAFAPAALRDLAAAGVRRRPSSISATA
jgi:hypothetical protein